MVVSKKKINPFNGSYILLYNKIFETIQGGVYYNKKS